MTGFESQQRALDGEATCEASDPSARGDHAVTWQQQRQRVAPHRSSDRARRARLSDMGRQLTVAPGRAVRYVGEGEHGAPAEAFGQEGVKGQVEGLERALEVSLELRAYLRYAGLQPNRF